MNSKFILSVTCSAILLASGCSLNSNSMNDFNNPPTNVVVTPAQAKVDAKILGGLIVLNQNEIAAATEAQRKAANPAVKNYASWMNKAHSQNLQETQNLSRRIGVAPVNGNVAMMLKQKGRQELAMLNRLNGVAFERAYISAMIKDHKAALQLIDHKLLNEATNPLLRRQLEITRTHVAHHLQQAQLIQRQIG
ncbi:DUF4142 domain-containing protein [Legionella jamestowniensis]|uniref:DUF4142 domain-containing protein n=1 Tax=Legionella jamestowniensis TaxID=455 RepID=A0A0W0UU50_9GAMM|nr:DUF4142 domain-containing protein [Legionella jamestowniensis]KTD11303.1 hypothetical protein Ljam_0497 [Legionella jamestowniensis]OCH98155.1 hypothetical protein A8135_13440 [Legionella jamestowniensis]SFL69358.1 putative membrane protein [Legionella jamestowniensis DSM 19215]